MKCRICATELGNPHFSGVILNKKVSYFDCVKCGYVQTENPYWLAEAYTSSINSCDTGIIARNISNANIALSTLAVLGKRKGCVVDFAGGYGFLTRMLRDQGIDAYWTDPHSENLVAKGFEFYGQNADLVTAFEAFEHFVEPRETLTNIFEISPNLLLSTLIIPSPAPSPANWWYYGPEHGQHIGFFRIKTFNYLASCHNKHFISNGVSLHLFSNIKISNIQWRTIQKVAQYFPFLVRRGLRSKTCSDYLQIISQKI